MVFISMSPEITSMQTPAMVQMQQWQNMCMCVVHMNSAGFRQHRSMGYGIIDQLAKLFYAYGLWYYRPMGYGIKGLWATVLQAYELRYYRLMDFSIIGLWAFGFWPMAWYQRPMSYDGEDQEKQCIIGLQATINIKKYYTPMGFGIIGLWAFDIIGLWVVVLQVNRLSLLRQPLI